MRLPKQIPIYGDIHFRDKNCRAESTEQKEFFGILKECYPKIYRLAFHPKNGAKRTPQQIQAAKEQGALNPGVSDIIVPGNPTFVCELKRVDHTESTLSKDELDYLIASQDGGAFSCIALGCEGALMALNEWLLLRTNIK